jgi:hypothetical protein
MVDMFRGEVLEGASVAPPRMRAENPGPHD